MPKIFSFSFFIFFVQVSIAQTDAGVTVAEDFAEKLYNLSRDKDLPIYNGVQHYFYSPTIEGTAYFLSDAWESGTLEYEGIVYNNIQMNYDQVTDKLVIAPEGKSIFISLFSPRVKWFSYSGNKFVWLEKIEKTDPPSGFYHVLATGKVNLFSKTIKIISEKIVDNTLTRKFEQTTRYYIQKEGAYYEVNNKSGLLSILREKRSGIQGVISQKKLKYRRDTESLVLSAVQYYNQ